MTKLISSIDTGAIAEGLTILALEDADPARAMLNAPALDPRSVLALQNWFSGLPDVRYAAYAPDFAHLLRALLRQWPEQVGREVMTWAASQSGLHDPEGDDQDAWPGHAFDAWWLALRTAREEGVLEYFDETPSDVARLGAMIDARQAAEAGAEQAGKPFSTIWDPWDSDRIAYNRRFKTEFDLWFYDHVFIPASFHLAEAAVRKAACREDRQFIMDYSNKLSTTARQRIAEDLPQLMPGLGAYALHTWQLERLDAHSGHPPDRLFPFAAVPDIWGIVMRG